MALSKAAARAAGGVAAKATDRVANAVGEAGDAAGAGDAGAKRVSEKLAGESSGACLTGRQVETTEGSGLFGMAETMP